MTNAEDKIFQEALSAIEEGDNLRAKDLLTRLLKMNQLNPQYWLWMSAVVKSDKERRFCLTQVLKYDPQNSDARRGLILMGDLPLDDNLRVPLAMQQRKWAIPGVAALEEAQVKLPVMKLALSILAMVVVVTLILLAATSNRLWIFRNRQVAVIGTAIPTPTFPATRTATVTLTPAFHGPTPPWMAMAQTYTPTPLYVNTPHAIIEAYRIAIRNYERGDWAQAITYFQQAMQQDTSSPDLPFLLGEVYYQNGQNNQALEAYNHSLELDPNFAPAYLGRARILLLREPEDFDDIIADLENAIRLDPTLAEAYVELANIQIKQGDLEAARENLEPAVQYRPESPQVSLAMGKIFLEMGEIETALEYAILANQQDITNLESYRFLGQAYQAAGDYPNSMIPLEVYTTHSNAEDALALAWLADAYAANGVTDKAIELYDEALRGNRFAVEVYLKRGNLHLGMEDYEKAFSDFEAAFNIRKTDYEACILTGETLLKLERPGNAYQQLSECQKLAEDDAQLGRMYFGRALALEALGNPVAIQEWERLLGLPQEVIQAETLATAQFYVSKYYTPTPSATPQSSATATARPPTRTRTITPTVTSTQKPGSN